MQQNSKGGVIVILFSALLLAGGRLAAAEPKPPKIKTQWTVISEVPGVQHTVFAGRDVFRYQNRYYCYEGGTWHQGSHFASPWMAIAAPPPAICQVKSGYGRKVPPGWSKGKKTGWHGAPAPPGQWKKIH
jgi:hypothetical protein|uniref:Uncharacterized protein n=1 Tax=Desulfobacca acetoxidans TaxID=60893 RepID=A0A7C3WRQ4_9BACT